MFKTPHVMTSMLYGLEGVFFQRKGAAGIGQEQICRLYEIIGSLGKRAGHKVLKLKVWVHVVSPSA